MTSNLKFFPKENLQLFCFPLDDFIEVNCVHNEIIPGICYQFRAEHLGIPTETQRIEKD